MSRIVNRKDLDFLLYDVLDMDSVFKTERYGSYDRDSVSAMLDTAQQIAEEVYLPSASEVDAFEPRFENGTAITHPSVKTALAAYAEAGFFSLGLDEEVGGLQAPNMLQNAVNGMFQAADIATNGYGLLTVAAINMLVAGGSEAQIARYLGPMKEGRWFGTMVLSEPHAGSSLSDIRTKATPLGEDLYAISGTKMWISGGEQDITENIIHFVLAKIPGGPPGVKGISLFIVPKIRVNEDGELTEHNNITLVGLNHKMGNKGTTNTLLNFGEKGETIGWLVGEEHQGLRAMFHMMNEARIGVGFGAIMLGLAGYLHSLDYARERLQGRHPANKDPRSPQLPIIEHADIKRLLVTQKAYVEGALCFGLYCTSLLDRAGTTQDKQEKQAILLLLDLITPAVKSWPSEYCLEANKHAIQVLGGAGYTKDHPVERFYRDNRLNPIHEGAHGIHGIDILGRKVRMLDGAALKVLEAEISSTLVEAGDYDQLSEECAALKMAVEKLYSATDTILKSDNLDHQLANATYYLDAFGHIIIAWMWLKQGVELSKPESRHQGTPFARGKLHAMRFFYRYELPKAHHMLDIAEKMDMTCADMAPEDFIGV